MRVRALVSFKGRVGASSWNVVQDEELELPDGVDWLTAGLVEAMEPATTGPAPHLHDAQTAVDPTPATAEKRKKGA